MQVWGRKKKQSPTGPGTRKRSAEAECSPGGTHAPASAEVSSRRPRSRSRTARWAAQRAACDSCGEKGQVPRARAQKKRSAEAECSPGGKHAPDLAEVSRPRRVQVRRQKKKQVPVKETNRRSGG